VFKITNHTANEILRLQNGKWFQWDNENRCKILRKYLSRILTKSEDDENLKEIANIAIRLAENPYKGGIIVFIADDNAIIKDVEKIETNIKESNNENDSEGKEDIFGRMGEPWKPTNKYTDDDKITLIAHDGATLNYVSNNNWEFRRLLTSDEIPSKIIGELFKYVEKNFRTSLGLEDNEEETPFCPLSFKGSRRWSAAITAFHKKVMAVLVISQDGEMYIWHVTGNEKEFEPEKIKVIEVMLSGETKIFDMAKKNYTDEDIYRINN